MLCLFSSKVVQWPHMGNYSTGRSVVNRRPWRGGFLDNHHRQFVKEGEAENIKTDYG